ncbi:cytotoxic translational repressor of toxin-antitoxin stability system [Streptomyces bottropensis]|uniref:cytotoxic translational repressor of toxin-antitoxin stability system n=1 Tax=Streptomyces bottropensis TaxID=42235 RepID=UPI0036CE2216
MVSWPAPDRDSHQKFCENDQWQPVHRGGDHDRYELALFDGRVLRTRISYPVDRRTYGRAIWGQILRHQLCVNESDFWTCVHDGVRPDRGAPAQPQESVPVRLAFQLIHEVKLPEEVVARMSKQEAVDRMNEYWTTGK